MKLYVMFNICHIFGQDLGCQKKGEGVQVKVRRQANCSFKDIECKNIHVQYVICFPLKQFRCQQSVDIHDRCLTLIRQEKLEFQLRQHEMHVVCIHCRRQCCLHEKCIHVYSAKNSLSLKLNTNVNAWGLTIHSKQVCMVMHIPHQFSFVWSDLKYTALLPMR